MDNKLVITIGTSGPQPRLRAEDLGALFSALAKDYKSITKGRTLVVASIERGSVVATLIDWTIQVSPYVKDTVEVAKGIKALYGFSKLLRDGIQAARLSKNQVRTPTKSAISRSLNALVKTAAENNCDIDIKHTSKDGEILEVKMTASQAVDVQSALQSPKVVRRTAPEVMSVGAAIDRLSSPGIAAQSPTEIRALVDVIFSVLQASGQTHAIPQIVSRLYQIGARSVAAALEAKMPSQGGNRLPPLTRT